MQFSLLYTRFSVHNTPFLTRFSIPGDGFLPLTSHYLLGSSHLPRDQILTDSHKIAIESPHPSPSPISDLHFSNLMLSCILTRYIWKQIFKQIVFVLVLEKISGNTTDLGFNITRNKYFLLLEQLDIMLM
jgi:hypothetical protein